MSGPEFGADPEGATPIDDEQRSGLKLSWVATRADLNQAELDNILQARGVWRRRAGGRGGRRLTLERLFDHRAVRDLHRDMYGDVWAWAGRFRTSDTNIGVPWQSVTEATAQLLGSAPYWFSDTASASLDEAAARLHHRLVEIHPFPNGNGRHAREIADLALVTLDRQPFSWGRAGLVEVSQTRRAYIDALRQADRGDYEPLYAFVRS